MRDQSFVPAATTGGADAPNRAARRARGKGSRQPLSPHLAATAGRSGSSGSGALSKPARTRLDYAARRSG
ncbi:hypothetical protein ACVGVM_18095 [Pseudonocardia bannensis]|uniref:Uncharacterized protein n=1 Tax=Pseudonocardia bannensis TaxID=630973 RepID=A0A848DP87_9PSEU|nr:hypothetical protein [Pseudonocardia bannensis]NMH94221.1 hypothetical protein [Pseudonocardia bannensis]